MYANFAVLMNPQPNIACDLRVITPISLSDTASSHIST